MPKKKQISIETIEYMQRTINELLESEIPQCEKRKLCIAMEKLLKDMKQKDNDFQYLHWLKFGKNEWNENKQNHFTTMNVGDTIKIPQEYITGPDYDGSDRFVSDIQGEWSRVYY